jgi:hypothetical protein
LRRTGGEPGAADAGHALTAESFDRLRANEDEALKASSSYPLYAAAARLKPVAFQDLDNLPICAGEIFMFLPLQFASRAGRVRLFQTLLALEVNDLLH